MNRDNKEREGEAGDEQGQQGERERHEKKQERNREEDTHTCMHDKAGEESV
jgi:hypothetical protein